MSFLIHCRCRFLPPQHRDRISALGFSLGYLGGGILFAFNVLTTLQPKLFGLADAAQAVQLSFLLVADWWLFFPCSSFFGSKSRLSQLLPMQQFILGRPAAAKKTRREIRRHRQIFFLLLVYWLYIDGLATIIRIAEKD